MATKVVKVTEENGQLTVDPEEVELRAGVDKLQIKNRAEFVICWRVPDGLFGQGFGKRVVFGIPSKAHKAAEHNVKTRYESQIRSSAGDCGKLRTKLQKRRGPKSDPIIIIDVVP